MTKDEQALKLIRLARTIQTALAENDGALLKDSLSHTPLQIHLDKELFAAVARASSPDEPTALYTCSSLQARLRVGGIEFSVCCNLV